MENYYKGKNVEANLDRNSIPIHNLPDNFLWMQVKGGSKMVNLLNHASGILEDKSATAVVWSGVGVAIAKAISCAEIIKRRFAVEHQVTKLTYKCVEEYWEPKVDGLETIVVKRQIPVIHILLSVDTIPDVDQLGYQTLQHGCKFWLRDKNPNSKVHQTKKPFKQRRTITKTE